MNYLQFLADYRIDYVTSGPNTRRGEVSVRCPWCGDDDPSHHMGIALDKEAWGCHRNALHRGKNPYRLVQALLACSFNQAKLIVGQYNQADPDTLEQALAMLTEEVVVETPAVEDPEIEYQTFKYLNYSGSGKRFCHYLEKRGFEHVEDLASMYGLRYATTGRYKDRIIIPTTRYQRVIAYTGRAITPVSNAPRYLSSSASIKTTIYNEDEILKGGKLLFISEGPFDALKLDYYGYDMGARATCLFGTSFTVDQLALLRLASKRYSRVILMLDHDAIEQSFTASDWLGHAEMGTLPFGVKDPGDLTKDQVHTLIRGYL